jgi:hypothetical protein
MHDDFICTSASVSELRAHLAEFLRMLEFKRLRLVLERYGAPIGALVTVNDLEVLRRRAEDRILDELVSSVEQESPHARQDVFESHWLTDEV